MGHFGTFGVSETCRPRTIRVRLRNCFKTWQHMRRSFRAREKVMADRVRTPYPARRAIGATNAQRRSARTSDFGAFH